LGLGNNIVKGHVEYDNWILLTAISTTLHPS